MKHWKFLLSALLCITLALSFAACGPAEKPLQTTATSTTPNQTTASSSVQDTTTPSQTSTTTSQTTTASQTTPPATTLPFPVNAHGERMAEALLAAKASIPDLVAQLIKGLSDMAPTELPNALQGGVSVSGDLSLGLPDVPELISSILSGFELTAQLDTDMSNNALKLIFNAKNIPDSKIELFLTVNEYGKLVVYLPDYLTTGIEFDLSAAVPPMEITDTEPAEPDFSDGAMVNMGTLGMLLTGQLEDMLPGVTDQITDILETVAETGIDVLAMVLRAMPEETIQMESVTLDDQSQEIYTVVLNSVSVRTTLLNAIDGILADSALCDRIAETANTIHALTSQDPTEMDGEAVKEMLSEIHRDLEPVLSAVFMPTVRFQFTVTNDTLTDLQVFVVEENLTVEYHNTLHLEEGALQFAVAAPAFELDCAFTNNQDGSVDVDFSLKIPDAVADENGEPAPFLSTFKGNFIAQVNDQGDSIVDLQGNLTVSAGIFGASLSFEQQQTVGQSATSLVWNLTDLNVAYMGTSLVRGSLSFSSSMKELAEMADVTLPADTSVPFAEAAEGMDPATFFLTVLSPNPIISALLGTPAQ